MSLAKQLTISIENKPGALASLCSELAKVAVNITAIYAPDPPGKPALRIVATPLETAKKVLDQMGLPYQEDTVLTVHLPNRPGALGKATRKLAEKGIDVMYAYGSMERGSEKAIIVLGVADPQAAAEIVK